MVNVEGSIALLPANPSAAQLDTYFNGVYQNLLANPAISGLALQLHWDRLNPNPPAAANAYAWNISDDAFNQVAAWNSRIRPWRRRPSS